MMVIIDLFPFNFPLLKVNWSHRTREVLKFLKSRNICVQGRFLWFRDVLLLILIGNDLSPKCKGTVILPSKFLFYFGLC